MQLEEKHLRVFADVSQRERGRLVFNRRHLFLTSLPCLSLLPALKTLFSRDRGFKWAKKRMGIFVALILHFVR